MQIKQFENKNLSHYSYAILSDCEKKIILIDPSRNPTQYLHYAAAFDAKIIGVIETHPHADFVSSHLDIAKQTGAKIYTSKLTGAIYPHTTFDDGDEITIDNIKLKAINTPGHSPDSICILMVYNDEDYAVFTGDTLFIGDCGRPDLRETAGNIVSKRTELAKAMFYSLREKLIPLDNQVLVYPAHGAGTLCGKALSEANSSTIGAEKLSNWCLQDLSEQEFITQLLADQPFVPKYFGYNVDLNRKGVDNFETTIDQIIIKNQSEIKLNPKLLIIDARNQQQFKEGYLPNSVNLMVGIKFETWLGSIINPSEKFYLTATDAQALRSLIKRIADIGYEGYIEEVFIFEDGQKSELIFDAEKLRNHPGDFTIVDIRNYTEVKNKPIFSNSINIPLGELREKADEIPIEKPVVVHCAGGYRSAAGSSILRSLLPEKTAIYDLSDAINTF